MPSRKESHSKERSSVVLCISGLAGSGKSTVARKLAEKYRLRYYSGGDALMALALEKGYSPLERGWWESKEGLSFLKKRGKDSQFDEAVDKKLLEAAEEGNVVLDSWAMPWLLHKGFKIWLEVSVEKRAQRIAGRDCISFEEALTALKQKEKQTKAIYRKMYGFSLGEDFAPFNLILDAETLNIEEVFKVLSTVVENVVVK
jgi:cytidylate kinase